MIVEWNTTKEYGTLLCNCQHFVDDLLKRGMDIDPKWSGNLGISPINLLISLLNSLLISISFFLAVYLENIRKNSELAKPHYIDENGKPVLFTSHKQLDLYVLKNNLSKDKLFKAFDRAYMINWKKDRDNDNYKPLNTSILFLKCHHLITLMTL